MAINEKLIVHCSKCHNDNNHTVISEIEDNTPYDEESQWWETTLWQIIKCDGCSSYTFRYDNVTAEDRNYETGEFEGTIILYPIRGKNILEIERFFNVPHNTRNIYIETINAFNNNQYVLCAAGIRATLESICFENNISEGFVEAIDKEGKIVMLDGKPKMIRNKDLMGKIAGLHQNEILTKKHSGLLHKLRFIGNSAIHTVELPKIKELRLGIEILEHTLENLYELEDKARRIKDPKKIK